LTAGLSSPDSSIFKSCVSKRRLPINVILATACQMRSRIWHAARNQFLDLLFENYSHEANKALWPDSYRNELASHIGAIFLCSSLG
jgi:hypothetical protein